MKQPVQINPFDWGAGFRKKLHQPQILQKMKTTAGTTALPNGKFSLSPTETVKWLSEV